MPNSKTVLLQYKLLILMNTSTDNPFLRFICFSKRGKNFKINQRRKPLMNKKQIFMKPREKLIYDLDMFKIVLKMKSKAKCRKRKS